MLKASFHQRHRITLTYGWNIPRTNLDLAICVSPNVALVPIRNPHKVALVRNERSMSTQLHVGETVLYERLSMTPVRTVCTKKKPQKNSTDQCNTWTDINLSVRTICEKNCVRRAMLWHSGRTVHTGATFRTTQSGLKPIPKVSQTREFAGISRTWHGTDGAQRNHLAGWLWWTGLFTFILPVLVLNVCLMLLFIFTMFFVANDPEQQYRGRYFPFSG